MDTGLKYCKIRNPVHYLVEDIEGFERSKRHTASSSKPNALGIVQENRSSASF